MSFWAPQSRFLIIAALITSCKVQVIDRTEELNGRTGGGTESETEETTATIDGTPVIDINSGATFTTSLSVTLSLNFSDVTEMYITNTADCADGGSWEAYATSKAWTLATSDAKNTVYIKFKNADGAESKCVSDTIIHDGTAPTAPSSISHPTSISSLTEDITVSWTEATDSGSGISYYEIAVGTTSGGTDVQAWTKVGNVTSTTLINLSFQFGKTYYVNLRAIDESGLIGTIATSSGFQSPPKGWVQDAYIKAINGDPNDGFGYTVAIDGDTIAAGAMGEGSNQTTITNGSSASSDNSSPQIGAAYVFKRTGSTLKQEAYIKPASTTGRFGNAIALSDNTLAVGVAYEFSNQTTITNGTTASSDQSLSLGGGAVFVYARTGSSWAQQAYIKPPVIYDDFKFGASVAIDGDTLAVGADEEDSNQTTIINGSTASSDTSTTEAGAAYIFVRSGVNWSQQAYLKPATIDTNENYGEPIAISGNTVVVAARNEDSNQTTITNGSTANSDNSSSDSGAVYVYHRSGTSWSQQAYIKASNADAGDKFGYQAVSIDGNTIAVAAIFEGSNQTTITNGTSASSDNSHNGSGAVYIYQRTGSTWVQQAYIKPSNSEANDSFGYSVSLDGNVLAVGTYGESSSQSTISNNSSASSDNSSSEAGAVYIYERTGTTWTETAYIKPSNIDSDDHFGRSVSLENKTLLVGASSEDSNQTTISYGTNASSDNSNSQSGAVYLFRYNQND